jgi:hypothetical protein
MVAAAPARAASPAIAARPSYAAAASWEALRKPVDPEDGVLHARTMRWMDRLPAELKPVATTLAYTRVVNRIADLWSHCEYTRLHFQSLLIDRRKGRRGFPPEVRQELVALQKYYHEHLSGLPAILWNAVPVNEPRIPSTVYPPLPDTGEIDVPPVHRYDPSAPG